MSDVQNVAAAETPTTEPVVAQPETTVEELPKLLPKAEEPSTSVATESKPDEVAPVEDKKDETAPAEEKKDEAAVEKVVEPITEGQLAYKATFISKFLPPKKEFWLSDEATSPQDLSSYLRGEKPEVANAVVAWASQTGKGLLFFNKKGDTTRRQPDSVLPLYDATDLKKQATYEITFKLHGHEHTLKAASETERDGWFMSLEKAAEMGKASKEEVRESEGYKSEMEKLNKPNVSAVAGAVSKRSESKPKKSTDAERPDSEAENEDKKKQKSRSTSRGVLNRLKGKKDEAEAKKEEKKEEKADKEESKPEEEHKVEEAAAPAAVAGVGAVAAAEHSTEEKKEEETPVEAAKPEEKTSKPAKRGSIFGKMSGWGGVKSPAKEKEQKEVEPKAEEAAVSEQPPVLPETATTDATDAEAEANKIEAKAETETARENQETSTPTRQKSKYLSGLGFMKRERSVSPSVAMKDTPAKTETEAPKEDAEVAKVEEPATETPAATETAATEPAEKTEEPAKTETSKKEKRESMLGSLGRRASKAMGGMRSQKKENATPATETTKEESKDAKAVADKPTTNGETKAEEPQQIGDVVPEAVAVGHPSQQPPVVAASA